MKKTFCVLIALTLLFSSLLIRAFAANNQGHEGDVWDGSISQPTVLVQKDGVYYYEITKCSELAYIAQVGGEWANYNYILGNNLILNDVIIMWDSQGNCTNGTGLQNWTPINNFSGEFDGNGYYISGLYIDSASGYRTGLFGYAYNGATIKNVNIKNAYVFGSWSAGGVVGEGKNIVVSNSSCSGIIKTENSNSSAEHGCGGICGYLSTGTISDCVNYAHIVADCHAGGVCGRAYAQIDNCSNYGNVACNNSKQSTYLGGIAGRSSHIESFSCFSTCWII